MDRSLFSLSAHARNEINRSFPLTAEVDSFRACGSPMRFITRPVIVCSLLSVSFPRGSVLFRSAAYSFGSDLSIRPVKNSLLSVVHPPFRGVILIRVSRCGFALYARFVSRDPDGR